MGIFFFQAEDGIRDLVRSRGLGDVYKRQGLPDDYMAGGYVTVPDKPGLGVDLNLEGIEANLRLSLIHI